MIPHKNCSLIQGIFFKNYLWAKSQIYSKIDSSILKLKYPQVSLCKELSIIIGKEIAVFLSSH